MPNLSWTQRALAAPVSMISQFGAGLHSIPLVFLHRILVVSTNHHKNNPTQSPAMVFVSEDMFQLWIFTFRFRSPEMVQPELLTPVCVSVMQNITNKKDDVPNEASAAHDRSNSTTSYTHWKSSMVQSRSTLRYNVSFSLAPSFPYIWLVGSPFWCVLVFLPGVPVPRSLA